MSIHSKRVLVMGLPGSGKTTFATELANKLGATHLNADDVRKEYDDWDFSEEGRTRQMDRMYLLSRKACTEYVVLDFVCPFTECREKIDADYVIWMDTIKKSIYDDTNQMFVLPTSDEYNLRLSKYYDKDDLKFVAELIDKSHKV